MTGRFQRIAIAGLGAAARTIHLPAYRKLPGVEVVGGFDPEVREGSFGFPLFSSLDEMLDRAAPDLLAVVTPPASHFELARLGLEAGCHLFCEKPFMPTLEEAREIVELAARVGRRVVVNNQYRFMNIHREAKSCAAGPDFGELLFLSARQTFYSSPQTEAGWRGGDPRRTCKEFGTHVFDLCRYFFGEDPVAITARMPKPGNPQGADFLNLIQLEFSGDRMAQITLDRLSRGRHRYLELRLDGSIGCIETRLGGGINVAFGVRGGRSRRPYLDLDVSGGGRARLFRGERFRQIATDPLDLFAQATRRLLVAFLEALESGREPPCSAADNLRTLALMLAAYESDRRRRRLEMIWGEWPRWREAG
ncbi:MAG: Gfo/Idh/MocA family oxidoreductase [Thermoanaerobaculia bacterium]